MSSTATPSSGAPTPTTSAPPKRSSGGLGPLIGIILLVVILVIGGVGAFVGLGSTTPATNHATPVSKTTSSPPSCQPVSSPVCQGITPPPATVYTHDVKVTSPFSTSQVGGVVTFNAVQLKPTWTPKSFDFFFGDGQSSGQISTSATTHIYSSAGVYDVYVQVTDTNNVVHDNLLSLLPFTATSSYANDPLGDHVQTGGYIVSNGTSTTNPTAILPAGGSVTLAAYISGVPVNGNTQVTAAGNTFNILGGAPLTMGTPSGDGLSSATALTATFTASSGATAGSYAVAFEAVTTLVTGGVTYHAWSNYTFTVYVGGTSGSGVIQTTTFPTHANGRPQGTIQSYEYVPGGAVSLDPSVDYETAGAEVIYNVYQTLIDYNGSQAGPSPNGFVPSAASCVPGTTTGPWSCQAMFGSSLITNGGADYTFVISPTAKFYDPANGAIMNVWPTDVVWSLARTCLFSDYPGVGNNPGWIQCQAILPIGSPSFDGGLHFPFDTTPANILNAMTVNDSTTCTATMMDGVHGDGCVTFHTGASGAVWPEFLELLADPNGAAIQSCRWEMTQGFTLQGWSSCNAPPAASAFPLGTEWDAAEQQGAPTSWNQNIAQNMVGSGPYYLKAYAYGQSYALSVSPAWTGTFCTGGHAAGCLPTHSQIQATYISNSWETSQTPGEQAYASGTADFATIPSTDTPTMLNDIAAGKIGAQTAPTLNIFFTSFNMMENSAAAQALTTVHLTAPQNMMQDLNMREFLTHTFPYQTQADQFCTVDGVQFCELYGGSIPHDMGNFYPANITWPSGNPDSNKNDVGGAAWWWSQVQADSFDGPVCTTASPCVYPLIINAGDPTDLAMYQQWAQWTAKISGNAVQAAIVVINFNTLVADLYGAPGSGGFSSFFLGWLPDYPDPSDYTVPMMYPDSTYTLTTAWLEGLTGSLASGNYMGTCAGSANGYTMVVTQSCQGSAYLAMYNLAAAGNSCAPPACSITQREDMFNQAEHIQNSLAMYVYDFQQVGVGTYATWINPASLTPNPILPGAVWYDVGYQGNALP